MLVQEISKWMAMNSEGIYATRPWSIFGFGPSTLPKVARETADFAGFNESGRTEMTADDVRFTSKGKTLFAFVMGWPQPSVLLQPLASNSSQQPGKILNVELLGHGAKLQWKQDEKGLSVRLPSEKPCDYAIALKIVLA